MTSVHSDPFSFSPVSLRAANLRDPELLFSSKSYLLSLNPLLSHHRHLYSTLPVPTPSASSPAKGLLSPVLFCAPQIGCGQVARWHPGSNLCSRQSLLLSCTACPGCLRPCLHHRTSPAGWAEGHDTKGCNPGTCCAQFMSDLHRPDHNPLQYLPLFFLWLGRTFKIKSSTWMNGVNFSVVKYFLFSTHYIADFRCLTNHHSNLITE